MSYGENSGLHGGLFSGIPRLSEPERKLFAGTASFPDQLSTGSLIYTTASSLVPLRGSGSDSCPDLKHLPGRLPKRPGPHLLESPSAQVRFRYERKVYGKKYGNISKNSTITKLPAVWKVSTLSLWTGQGRGGWGTRGGQET